MSTRSIDSKFGINKESIEVGTTFQKIMLGLVVTALFAVLGIQIYIAPKTFTVDDKHWACQATEPVGIGAECTLLAKKKFGLRTE